MKIIWLNFMNVLPYSGFSLHFSPTIHSSLDKEPDCVHFLELFDRKWNRVYFTAPPLITPKLKILTWTDCTLFVLDCSAFRIFYTLPPLQLLKKLHWRARQMVVQIAAREIVVQIAWISKFLVLKVCSTCILFCTTSQIICTP